MTREELISQAIYLYRREMEFTKLHLDLIQLYNRTTKHPVTIEDLIEEVTIFLTEAEEFLL